MLTLIALVVAGTTADAPAKLSLIEKGASAKIGHYAPLRCELSDKKPEKLAKAPEGLRAPLYGILEIPGAKGRTYLIIVDEPEGSPSTLYVDSNGNGDLTDDPAPEWKGRATTKDDVTYTQFGGSFVLKTTWDGEPTIALGTYRFDKTDPARAQLASFLFFYRDYAVEGDLGIGDKTYHVMLDDAKASADFSGKSTRPDDDQRSTGKSPVRLLVDVNGNGKFDNRGESFAVNEPFNIGGTTWELADISADGSSMKVVKSAETVEIVPTPPDHTAGKPILAFKTTDVDGKAVDFPAAYKGKLVMLDFWATWCGPCMKEMPNVIAAYEKYHDKGFDVLGISLDQKDKLDLVPRVTNEKKMPWPQVYDGGFWNAEIAQKYAIQSIPAGFLVDGDTGTIIAMGNDTRGEELDRLIQEWLAKRRG